MRIFCGFAVAVLLVSTGVRAADDKPNPIVAGVKANLKDPTKPFTLLVLLKVKEGSEEKFEKAFATARAETRKEKGNMQYDLSRDAKSPGQYIVYERWANLAALEAHIKAKHIETLLAEIGPMLASPPEGKTYLPVE